MFSYSTEVNFWRKPHLTELLDPEAAFGGLLPPPNLFGFVLPGGRSSSSTVPGATEVCAFVPQPLNCSFHLAS